MTRDKRRERGASWMYGWISMCACMSLLHASPPILLEPLANDDGIDPASLELRFLPRLGTATLLATGQVEYLPNPGVTNAVDSMAYRVCSLTDATDCQTLSLDVHVGGPETTYVQPDVHSIPTWTTGAQPVHAFDLLANDLNVNAASLAIVFNPIHGTVQLQGGLLQYRPPFGFSGVDSVLMSVVDADATSQGFSVTFHVGAANAFAPAPDIAWFEIRDEDADGLSDHWETSFASSLTTLDLLGDPDSDGMPNRDECIAGTDPLDAQSYFHFTGMVYDPDTLRFVLSYSTGIERRYEIDRSTNARFANPTTSFSGFRGNGAIQTMTVSSAPITAAFRLRTRFE